MSPQANKMVKSDIMKRFATSKLRNLNVSLDYENTYLTCCFIRMISCASWDPQLWTRELCLSPRAHHQDRTRSGWWPECWSCCLENLSIIKVYSNWCSCISMNQVHWSLQKYRKMHMVFSCSWSLQKYLPYWTTEPNLWAPPTLSSQLLTHMAPSKASCTSQWEVARLKLSKWQIISWFLWLRYTYHMHTSFMYVYIYIHDMYIHKSKHVQVQYKFSRF